jgi:hypothetical protein
MDENTGSPCVCRRLNVKRRDFAQSRLPGPFGPLNPEPLARYAQEVEASAQPVSFRKAKRGYAPHQIVCQHETQRACVNGFGKVMWARQ